jgi:hypothetical protein
VRELADGRGHCRRAANGDGRLEADGAARAIAIMFAQLLVVGFDWPLKNDITSVVLSVLVLGVVLARQAVVLVDNRRLNNSLLEARHGWRSASSN